MIKFIGIKYCDLMKDNFGDYFFMMNDTSTKRLLIYNENVNYINNPWYLKIGKGNLIVRQKRIDNFLNEKNIVHSIGIPTGPEFNVITSDIINLIDKCFNNIYLFIKKNNYEEICWSSNQDNLIEKSTYKPCYQVRKYITDKIKELANKVNGKNWKKNFLYFSKKEDCFLENSDFF